MSEPGTALERRLAHRELMSDDELRRSWRIAKALAAAQVFKAGDTQMTPEKAFAVMLIGGDLGLSPTQALMGIHIVKGRPVVGYTMLGAFVRRTPGYDYRVREHDWAQCTIDFFIDGEKVGSSTFTIEDAKKQGLVKKGGAWETVPRNMLLARALSNGVRWYMPDATGGVPVYVTGEIEERSPELTRGIGNGEARGVDLGPRVEKVLARAAQLGHPSLADRATAEITLSGRSAEVAAEWVKAAEGELDEFEPPIVDAELVGGPNPAEEAQARLDTAAQLEHDAEDAEAQGQREEAEGLREGAWEMREQARALRGGQ